MNGYFLDTSVIIDYLHDKNDVVDLVDKLEGEISSSYVCLAELYEGIARSKHSDKAEKQAIGFFGTLNDVYGLDSEIAKKFGQIRKDLKDSGQRIEDFDLLLTATCLANDLTLVTSNKKHFSRIRGLAII